MTIEIMMPALSPTMEEGNLAKWLVKEGDNVAAGDLIAEIETDKAVMEFEAVDEGIIGQILVAEGSENVKVGTLIAVILEEGEEPGDLAKAPPITAAAKPTEVAETAPISPKPAEQVPASSAPAPAKAGRVFASPLARRIAADKGVDLAILTGSGPGGRIIKADVTAASASTGSAKPAASALSSAPTSSAPASSAPVSASAVAQQFEGRGFTEIPLDGMRKTIAARLTEAKQTIPHFYLRRDIHLDALLKFRGELNGQLAARNIKLSVNDFIIKASALALQQVPAANAVWAGDRILQLEPSDVAVAVAIEGGLFTPVLQDAETKSLSQLSAQMKDMAARAKTRKLAPHEYQGGSFAISNLGMMGIDNFDAVINPPHGSILAVGAGTKRAVVGADGTIGAAVVMSVTLSCDHRVIDGAVGAAFLQAIKDNLENPLVMLA